MEGVLKAPRRESAADEWGLTLLASGKLCRRPESMTGKRQQ
jgi:hypothetical protein